MVRLLLALVTMAWLAEQLRACCETGLGDWLERSRAGASGVGCLPRVSRTEGVIEISCPETAQGFENALGDLNFDLGCCSNERVV